MIWIFWLYIVPALFILTFILPARGILPDKFWHMLFFIAVCPVINLLTVLGVIWKLCTIKDMQSYMMDSDIQKRIEEFEKELDKIMNDNK